VSAETAAVDEGLAANFAAVPKRALEFATKARVHGDPAMDAWEPQQGSGSDDADLAVLRESLAERDGNRCVYCHARTATLQLDTVNDVHRDLAPDNQVLGCPLCHGYHHLGELPGGAAGGRVAYLPGLDASDVNLLQRVLTAELYAGTAETAQDARDLINWLASHSVYVAEAFGTDDPSVFASRIERGRPCRGACSPSPRRTEPSPIAESPHGRP